MSEDNTSLFVRLCNLFLYVVTFFLVILAIAITAVRYHPGISDIVESNIESKLADIINADITIESFDLDRRQASPKILAENVLITDRSDQHNTWQIKKVLLGIDVMSSLLSRSLRVTELVVEGIDFEVHRDSNGDINVNQTFLIPVGSMEGKRSGGEIGDVQVQLTDSNLVWRDEILNLEYIFNDINMLIDATSKGHHLSLLGRLPVEMGESIQLHAQIDGDIKNIVEANAKFYIKVDGLITEEISSYFVKDENAFLPIVADAELWGASKGLSLQSLRGNFSINDLVAEDTPVSESCLTDSYIKSIAAQFLWQADESGWRFDAEDIFVETSTGDWPSSNLHISENTSETISSYYANISHIKIDDICNTLNAYASYGVDINNYLQDYQVNGHASDVLLRADIQDKKLKSMQYAAKVNDVVLQIGDSGQLIKGITGYTEGSLDGGLFSMNTDRLIVGLPGLYKESPLEFAVQGDLHWKNQDQTTVVRSNALQLFNDDLDMDLRWYTLLDDGQIYVDSQISLPKTRAEVIWKYFPTIKKTIRTKKWLRQALHAGDAENAKIAIRGNMRKFPFKDHAGVFETRLEVSNGLLEFKRDWPKLQNVKAKVSIDDARIRVTSDHSRLFDTNVKNVDIHIESFLRAVLYGKGTAEGSAKDLLKFLDESKLVSGENSIINTIDLEGDSRLELDFSRTLSLKIDHPFQIKGDLHFLGNSLGIPAVGLQMQDIGGKFSFDKSGATADSVNAILYGNPIRLAAIPVGEGATNISFTGPFDLDKYIEQRYTIFKDISTGTAHVEGSLRLPSMFKKNNPEKISVNVKSDLHGVEIHLPAPFEKAKEQRLASSLIYSNKDNSLKFGVGELASLYFGGVPKRPLKLKQITLGADEKQSEVKQDVLMVNGSIRQLAVDDWLATAKNLLGDKAENKDNPIYPDVDVVIDELQWSKWPAKNLALKAETVDDVYRVSIDSSLGKGVIRVPDQQDLPITAKLESLIVNKGKDKAELDLDPTQMRPFLFTSDKLTFNDINFKNVFVRSAKEPTGLSFNKIQLEAQDLTVNGSGAWRLVEQGQEQSFFNLALVSIDLEDSIEDLGFKSGLHRGEADSLINIRWNGAPHQFSYESGQGSATINARDGRIKEVDPGNAGRLLALLNLSAISRRLSLDFKDVTKEGFSFDAITGALHLQPGGILQADEVTIDSSSAKIVISGHTDLKNRTYNQKILVTPSLSGTLTATGALVGGPVGAAAGLLADQVVKVVGLNKVSSIEYKMTGTWEEPKLEKIGSVLVKQSTNK